MTIVSMSHLRENLHLYKYVSIIQYDTICVKYCIILFPGALLSTNVGSEAVFYNLSKITLSNTT
jgi:hypothetical protein